uniref:TBC1 domain family member 30 n=1 Tax=Salmo trutta TaxID=8032 RepID=A0A674DX29_SALTR
MSSRAENVAEFLEIDICHGDVCSEVESGLFINSGTGASLSHGFSEFQQWTGSSSRPSSDQNNTDCVSKRPRDCSNNDTTPSRSLYPQNGPGCGSGDRVILGELRGHRAPRSSIVDCLLVELYDTYSSARISVDSPDSSTEASSSELFCRSNTGSSFLQELQEKHTRRHQVNYLSQKAPEELSCIVGEVLYRTGLQSAKLLRQLKRRDRLAHKLQKNYDIITACLQAASQKRRVDTRLKFTIEPSLGKNGFQQWYDALKAVVRLPTGIPKEWRKRVWLTLADHYLHSISIDWDKTLRFAFNERSNPDDDSLGIQIVKDLHRTGCSSYSGQEGEQDRVVLKRVLLAYARWNKAVGYCQGFNVLAALILEVTEGNESHALKVMIYLIDKVLPESYFANNLRSLSVDMAVFRDLLRMKLPHLSQHLHLLQKTADREAGGSYEPPLTNVFTMQWFLTMFATCLPPNTVLKIWDSVFFEGSEVLLRVALAIWSHLEEHIECCQTADDFYSTMGWITQEMLENSLVDCSHLMQTVYSMAAFPFPQLAELREKYTYNITPFPTSNPNGSGGLGGWEGDEDEDEDEDAVVTAALGCLGPLGGLLAPELQRYQRHIKDQRGGEQGGDMAALSPGAVDGGGRAEHEAAVNSMLQERMSMDISALKKQYSRLKRHQQQQARQLYIHTDRCPATSVLASQLRPSPVVNHLLLGRKPRNSRERPPSCPRGLQGGVPLSQGQSSPATAAPRGERGRTGLVSHAEDCRSRAGSPWRAHVRTHRRNVAREQLGFGDVEDRRPGQTEEEEDRRPGQTEEEEEDRRPGQTEEEEEEDRRPGQTEEEEEDRRPGQTEEEERDGVGEGKADDEGSHLPVSPAQTSRKEEHLVSLELDSGSELNQTPPPRPSSDPDAPPSSDPDAPPSSDPDAPPSSDPDAPPSSDPDAPPSSDPDAPPSSDPDAPPSSPSIPELPVLPPLPRPSSHLHGQQSDPSVSYQNIYCSPVTPSNPHSPVTPSNPHSPVTLSNPHSPVTPSNPHSPVTPSNPHSHVTPSNPHSPVTPSNPHSPGSPVTPSNPHSPVTPSNPHSPGSPVTPSNPHSPVTPSNPHSPGSPVTLSNPHSPVTPSNPHSPVTPSNPHSPVTPSNPHSPVTLSNPHSPGIPVTPSNPHSPDRFVTLSNPPTPVTPSNPHSPVTLCNHHSPVTPSIPHSPGSLVTPSNPHSPVTPSNPHSPVTPSNLHSPVTLSNPHSPGIPVTPSNPHSPDSFVTLSNPPTPVTLSNPHSPVTPCNPHSPVTPSNPHSPGSLVTPSNPPTPVTSSNLHSPVTPSNPPTPVTLSNPHSPGSPVTPSNPHSPVTPSNPHSPGSPVTPSNPHSPVTPSNPHSPGIPVTPSNPHSPVTPSNPHSPVTPPSPSLPLSCPSVPQDHPRTPPSPSLPLSCPSVPQDHPRTPPSPSLPLSCPSVPQDHPRTPPSPSLPLSCPSVPQDHPRTTSRQVFSPFPSVKQHRRSAAARNLGLYGPTPRTPTVHFPGLSLGRAASTLSTRRR